MVVSAGNVLCSFRLQKAAAVHSMREHLPLRLPADTRPGLVSTEAVVVKSPGDKQLKNHQRVGSIAILDRRRDIPWDGPALFGV